MRRSQPRGPGLLCAPPLEVTETRSECEQAGIGIVRDHSLYDNIEIR